jgi:DNA-binding cell septation regulator SpoVG
MKIENMKKGDWGKVKAFFDIKTAEGFTMKGFKLVEGVNGIFAGFPSKAGQDGEYHDTVWAERDLKDEVSSLATKLYNGEDDSIIEMELDDIPRKTPEPQKTEEELPF